MKHKRTAAIVGALMALAGQHFASADAVYTYTGARFSSVFGDFTCVLNVGECQVNGQIEIEQPLAANLIRSEMFNNPFDNVQIGPSIRYNFTDGVHVFNNDTSPQYSWTVWTDGSGNITNWTFGTQNFSLELQTINADASVGDSSGEVWSYGGGSNAVAGSWAVSNSADPVLPTGCPLLLVRCTGPYTFANPTPGTWFDPAPSSSFSYALQGGGDFTVVGAPPASYGFGPMDVVVAGHVVDTLDPGDFYNFGPGVSAFTLTGITPPADASDPASFPTYLDFTGDPTLLTMTPLAPILEPSIWAVMLVGFGWTGAALRRRRPGDSRWTRSAA